jgi:2-hydroxy fatty acid dioxygenase
MKRVDALLSDYGAHHRTRGNLICHAFGVTLIAWGIIAMLGALRVGPANLAELLIAGVVLYYATLDVALAGAMLGIFAILDLAARAVGDWRIGAAAFAVGWVFQAVGHAVYEKNHPAFFRNLLHLLVGPLFLANELLKIRRVAPAAR